jgi:hypothetical protein
VPSGKDEHLDHQDVIMVGSFPDLPIVTVHIVDYWKKFHPVNNVPDLSSLISSSNNFLVFMIEKIVPKPAHTFHSKY